MSHFFELAEILIGVLVPFKRAPVIFFEVAASGCCP